MKVKFCGAATSVTGSCHLIDIGKYKFLLDCGQFQGTKSMEALNSRPFDFNPAELDFMLLSHAHIDHCGRIPLLVKNGFSGDIFCTDATNDLIGIMLRDSAHIQEKEAESQNKKNNRLGRPLVKPLYTMEDAEASLPHFKPVLYGQYISINDDIKVMFHDAGHILGSAILEIRMNDYEGDNNGTPVRLVFSGDLGVNNRPILRNPEMIDSADYLIMETTYGDRLHTPNSDSIDRLVEIVLNTTRRGGSVIIPAFSVGRTQELIFLFHKFFEEHKEFRKEMGDTPVYVDSPMAAAATQVFRNNAHVFDDEMRQYLLKGYNPLDFKNLKFVQSVSESQMLNTDNTPKVIISASGMCEAGRIKHHLKHNIWNPKNSVVFVGYQAEGTLGRNIVNGEKNIKIFGENIHVEAEIFNLEGFSGHADKNGLLEWLGAFSQPPKMTFLVHGEESSKVAFAAAVRNLLHYPCEPVMGLGAEYILKSQIVDAEISDAAASVLPSLAGTTEQPDSAAEAADGVQSPDSTISEAEADVPIVETVTSGYIPSKSEKLMTYLKLKEQLATIHNNLENILYHTQLATDDALSDDKIETISNVLLQLEKSTINLGSAVSLENDIGTAGETGKKLPPELPVDSAPQQPPAV